jgi:hypothetical protein
MCSILVLLLVIVIVQFPRFESRIDHDHEQEHEHEHEEDRKLSRKGSPSLCSFVSSFSVQSQSQQAHASVPFSCRQLRRA